jgi:hypothetical protein
MEWRKPILENCQKIKVKLNMKPLGRKYFGSKYKTDYHFNKKWFINWWEYVCTPNKRLEQRRVKKEIENQLRGEKDG